MDARVFLLLALLGCIQCKVLNLSCQQIKSFVDGHNSRRKLLASDKLQGQPAASRMKSMVWDSELAAKAAKWASVLRHYHNPDRSIGSGRFTTGENLFWYSTTSFNYKLNPEKALSSWFNEHKDYHYGPITNGGNFGDIGHYTQMVWSDSTHLGCAISQWAVDGWNKFFVVCNYGPGGNMLGKEPYKSGKPSHNLLVTCATTKCDRPYGDYC